MKRKELLHEIQEQMRMAMKDTAVTDTDRIEAASVLVRSIELGSGLSRSQLNEEV